MKRMSALFLVLCMIFTAVMPMTAFAADAGNEIITESSKTPPPLEAEGGETTPDTPPTPDPATIEGDTGSEATPTTAPEETAADCATQSVTPLSGWEDGGSEFYTKIRLTVTDRSGNPIAGAVYGLYRTSDNGLVEYLTTDRYGVAVSGDVPVDTDYYLLEYSVPEGFLSNPDPKYINLTEICAPSRVDESVVYDPITGVIKVIKTDEDGNPLSGVGFYVYRADTWTIVDTIYTDSNGEAYTITLPYGWYELYEFDIPQGMAGGGYYSQMIEYDGETHEIYITNYRAYGSMYIYKTGNDGRKIGGAVFSIFRADNDEWIEDITTSSSGYAYSSPLLMGDYYAVEKSVPAPYALDTTRRDFTIYYNGQTVSFNLTNNREGDNGKIKVIKTDDSGNPLSGVVFGVYRSWDGKKLTELTTGADGTAEYSLIPDDYYLVELSGKTGYEMATGQITFTIDGSGATVEKTVVNPKIRIFGKVKVIKTDEAGNPIPGVRMGVYCHNDNLLEELTTGQDGTATSGVLNEGTGYYILEHEGAAGYLSDTETRYPFDITQNNVIVSVTVENPRISGGVKIVKQGGDGLPLAGVVFGIYKGGNKLMELTTGEDGTATSGTLYYGDDYELRELSTVEGYELITEPIPFCILEQDAIIEIPVSNPLILGSITVIKVDAESIPQPLSESEGEAEQPQGNPLTGAIFGLYNAQGQKIAEFTVDETGRATYEGLPKASYFLKELVAPEGFIPLDELLPFAINEQGENIEIVVPNAKGYGIVKIIKHGENEMLPGVVFEIFRAANDIKIAELTTGEDGAATQELPLGRYYLLEKSTAAGYMPLSGSVFFTLTAEGATVELSIENQKEPTPEGGTIKLIKKSAKDDTLLPGAVFGVYRVSDNVKVAELVTGSDGTATGAALPELEQGYYLLELSPPTSYKAITEKIPVTVKNGETTEITVKNEPIDPTPENGTLEIIKKSDAGKRLSGAVFGVYHASDDTKITELTTDKDGKATMELPAGHFYLRELKAPQGFQLSGDKVYFTIKTGEKTEIALENKAIPTTPDPEKPKPGKVVVTKEAEDTGKKLSGAVFGVYSADNDKKQGEITTGRDGTATMELPAGRFYLLEKTAPQGFQLSGDKVYFRVRSGETTEITVENKAVTPTAPENGILEIIKKSDTGKRLSGAVFGVYSADNDRKQGEITTGRDGTATMELPAGRFYLLEKTAPQGFQLSGDKVYFRVKSGETTEITVENKAVTTTDPEKPKTGNLELLKSAEGTGKRLSGAVFDVYRVSDNGKVTELTTDKDGKAFIELPEGNFYLRELTPPTGFVAEKDKIYFTIFIGKTVLVEVTNMRETTTPPTDITIPKTGGDFPAMSYTLSALCFTLAAFCSAVLLKRRRGIIPAK